MESKIIMNGRLEVFSDGTIYELREGRKRKLTITNGGGKQRYPTTSIREDGKQKSLYIHRLVAEAFLPNPENKPCVSFKDGNPQNCKPENLEWKTYKEMSEEAMPKIRKTRTVSCKLCGSDTVNSDKICPVCRLMVKAQALEEAKQMRQGHWRERIDEEFKGINFSTLTESEALAVRLRQQYISIGEIGNIMGITRQAVDAKLKNALRKAGVPPKTTKVNKRYFLVMKNKLSRKENLLEGLKAECASLTKEIQAMKAELESYSGLTEETPGAATPRESR